MNQVTEKTTDELNNKDNLLTGTRQEMYRALELFHNHVKHTISLMFTLLTAVLAIFSLASQNLKGFLINHIMLRVVSSTILLLLVPLGVISTIIIGRYYKLYVAALVFAADVHKKAGINGHLWLRNIEKEKVKLGENYSLDKLVSRRAYSWPHSWILYAILIGMISFAGLVMGIAILLTQ